MLYVYVNMAVFFLSSVVCLAFVKTNGPISFKLSLMIKATKFYITTQVTGLRER